MEWDAAGARAADEAEARWAAHLLPGRVVIVYVRAVGQRCLTLWASPAIIGFVPNVEFE